MKIHKHPICVVVSPMGMVRGVGVEEHTAWAEAANGTGLKKCHMKNDGYKLREGIVVDGGLFTELIT